MEMKGVKVELKADFSIVRETLSRCGIVNKQKKVITPTCYLFRENDEYFVCHFKELLSMFDEDPDILDEKDTCRRNSICTLLENWGLIDIIDNGVYQEGIQEKIFVLPFKEKNQYEWNHKFCSFGKLTELRSGYEYVD